MKERIIVVGLGFGDEGKGSITDYLVREHRADAVVRYSGGAQCAHRVVTSDGREHVFAQFGAGSFVDDVETYLSKHVVVNPLNLFREAEHLADIGAADVLDRLFIDAEALLVTPFHIAANRLRELARGVERHGTTGQGIGEARLDEISGASIVRAGDVFFEKDLLAKLRHIQSRKRDLRDWLLTQPEVDAVLPQFVKEDRVLDDPDLPALLVERYSEIRSCVVSDWGDRMRRYDTIVFEGAQGVLLDESHGFHPHTTWTSTTSKNAHQLLDAAGYKGERRTIGVTRCYSTRHGEGPFPTHDPMMYVDLLELEQETAQDQTGWAGDFRVGPLDLNLLDYALTCDGRVDEIAVTCLDRRLDPTSYSANYEEPLDLLTIEDAKPILLHFTGSDDAFVERIELALGLPVTILSYGPTADDKRTRTA